MNIENHIHNGAKTAITPNYMSQGAYLQHGFRPQSIALETIYDPVGSVGGKFEHLWYVGDQPVTYHEVIKEILSLLKEHTGSEAIGIRLREGEDDRGELGDRLGVDPQALEPARQ